MLGDFSDWHSGNYSFSTILYAINYKLQLPFNNILSTHNSILSSIFQFYAIINQLSVQSQR